ncbi:MAG: hypothetical protein RR942_07755 [Romboutsia sp.]
MQDIKRNKRRMVNQQMAPMANKMESSKKNSEECVEEELNRGCGCKPNQNNNGGCPTNNCNNNCNCNNSCDCGCNHNHHDHDGHKKPHCEPCEPCEVESDVCFDNVCTNNGCCNPIVSPKFSTANATPLAIEANRVFDTMVFQTFTDAVAPNGDTLVFDYDVVEVNGPVPKGGQVNITIEKVCMNYSGIVIDTGTTTLEDYDIEPLEPITGKSCETKFEYAVCGRRNATCCNKGKGTNVVYKERGLSILVEDLVLELRGKCGCTEIVAFAYPAVKGLGGEISRCCDVEFFFNTLTAPICLTADGRAVTLRQDFQTNLTVDCIGKALLRSMCDECCEYYYELCIPNDIDLIMCLQSVVSTLMSEQIVVLGSPAPIQPRVVDTFNKVCDFKPCGLENNNNNGNCGCSK